MSENSVRRLLDLRHASQMWIIDAALAKMDAEPPIDLPKVRPTGRRRNGLGVPDAVQRAFARCIADPGP